MGFFSGLSTKRKSARFDVRDPISLLPPDLRQKGKTIARNNLALFDEILRSGESQETQELFSRLRSESINDFERTVEQAGLDLNRSGLASSGEKDRILAALALSFGDRLNRQDAARNEALLNRKVSAAQQGLNSILGINNQTVLVPKLKIKGLFDGMGTTLLGNAASAGAEGFGAMFGIQGMGRGIGGPNNPQGVTGSVPFSQQFAQFGQGIGGMAQGAGAAGKAFAGGI